METEPKFPLTQKLKTQKLFHGAQIFLRVVSIATTLAATSVMLTSKQSVTLYGTFFEARYNYSSAFKFFAFANAVACAFSILSLLYIFIVGRNGSYSANYFLLFLHDLLMMSLVLAGCGAATAVGWIGKYGYDHIGWMAICDKFIKYCNKLVASIVLSYLAFLCLMVLAIITASRARYIHV